ncbi:MAG: alanine racemase [Clostridiales Family XIII bacterium]|jgi:alanine racemase|nr:alanine racemase [Clostridiales Family XIII bacterium]
MFNEGRRAAWVEIRLPNIVDNFLELRRLSAGSAVIASVKADAYGHGAVKVSWELVKNGVDYLGVATIEEAVALRSAGIRVPIILYSLAPRGNAKDLLDLGITPVISTYDDAVILQEAINVFALKKTVPVFIAIETGMGRLGFLGTKESMEQISHISNMPNIKIQGLFSHLASADSEDETYTNGQIDAMRRFESALAEYGVAPSFCTMANSAAVIKYPQAHFEAVRPGIALYGIYPEASLAGSISLEPAMSVRANIVFLKEVPAGFCVSYDMKWQAQRPSLIGTLPLGYADGLPRTLSGKGRVIVNGVYAPIVGNICMDQCMIDVTDVPGVTEYDEVVIMGTKGGLTISAEEIAEKTGTITYEVLTRFGQRLPKAYK